MAMNSIDIKQTGSAFYRPAVFYGLIQIIQSNRNHQAADGKKKADLKKRISVWEFFAVIHSINRTFFAFPNELILFIYFCKKVSGAF